MSDTETPDGEVSDEATPNEAIPDSEVSARVEDAIASVEDPDFGASVLDAGLVTDVAVADGAATITVDLAGADPEAAEDVTEAMRREAFEVPGVETVRVEGETPDSGGVRGGGAHGGGARGDAAGSGGAGSGAAGSHDHGGAHDAGAHGGGGGLALPEIDHVIAVGSAKGGVGKTTVATHLARALADEYDVGLFDADIHGPNVPEMVGVEGPVEATDDGRAAPADADGMQVMSVGLVADDAPLAWRGAMAHDALTELLEDTAWTDRDVLVVDLPPGTGDVVLTMLQEVPVAGSVLVTTPFPTSLSDTGRSAALLEENGVPVVGAAVNMRGFTCENCGHDHDLYGGGESGPEEELGVEVLAELPFDRGLQNPGEPGEGERSDAERPDAATPDPVADLAQSVGEFVESDDSGPVSVPDSALDVRGLPPRIRHEQVGEEFAALAPGEEFYVVNDHDPSPLAQMLAGEFAEESADEAFETCEVHRRAPDEWVLELQRAV
ncbi:P-loop NTPase [Halorussus gelatinilyticus]|uniref:Iron-sulfur cluster carrier protein n=1 Tax=Halorussus gelatinilyticus TaxID=2937524 RepID=A0A8U0IL74_9EURY|nr:P-loop NTPase [Halorussus gelatinilyticus]UPW01405.1 P-loop NTPase [Halorussus gelatinilyticus]